MPDKFLLPHMVTMENRSAMTVTGVNSVVSYDEYRVVLRTDYGTLLIQGRQLMAGEISSTNNTMKLTGRIEALQYKAAKDKSRGLLAKLTK